MRMRMRKKLRAQTSLPHSGSNKGADVSFTPLRRNSRDTRTLVFLILDNKQR